MLETYKAKIRENQITWSETPPSETKNGAEVEVIVTIIKKPSAAKNPNRERAVAALQKIADNGGVSSIPDPDKWLLEIRKDRPLPGRD
ncbi:MAG: hypothetical protein ACRD6X_12865 [Pyrinomonadaceae bacterium]